MKKKLSLVLAVLAFCGAANAAVWNFEPGLSAETTAAIIADTENWAENMSGKPDEYEVGEAKLISRHNAKTWEEAAPLTAGGAEIKEFAGLKFIATGTDAIRIGAETTQLCTDFGFVAGTVSRLRVTNAAKLILPAMVAGDEITIKWGSSKPKDADTGRYPISDQLTPITGVPGSGAAADYKSQTMYEITYRVNDDITEPTEIVITSAKSGIDIFSITTPGTGGSGAGDEPKKALLVSNDEGDVLTSMISTGVQFAATISGTGAIALTDEAVQAAEVVVVSNNIAASDAVVASLKGIVAYKPVVNFSAALYDGAWGTAAAATSGTVELTETYKGNDAVSALESDPEIAVDGTASAIDLGDYFKNDAVIATADGKPAIHIHNATRNAYIGAPMSATAIPNSGLADLVVMAAKTNKAATATATPVITSKQANQETTVTITCGTAGATIYYTVDGTEPTEASTVYTEPIAFHEKATVKAIAKADGYNLSAVASAEVAIAAQVATPEIAVAKNGATSTVTLSCATEGADIYYNFADFSASTKDIDILGKKYTEPIVLSEPTMIYAKAVKGEDALDSEMASYYVAVADVNASNIRLDVVSRFTADYFAWAGKTGSSAVYIWSEDPSKNQASWTEGEVKTLTPAEGATADLDWKLVSKGQKLCLESGSVEVGVGDPEKTGKGERGAARFFDSVEDLIGSEIGEVKLYTNKNFLGTKSAANEENTDNATVESTKKFTAPFDVVVYLGNGKGNEKHADLEISEDGQTWTKAADLNVSKTLRYIKKTRVSIDKDSYVRVLYKDSDVNVADIVILNNGEESKKYDAAEFEAAGIEDVEAVGAEVVRTEIYNINGVQLPELTTGVNIVRTYYSDGSVKTEKVLSK